MVKNNWYLYAIATAVAWACLAAFDLTDKWEFFAGGFSAFVFILVGSLVGKD